MHTERDRENETRPWINTVWNWSIFIIFIAVIGNWPAHWEEMKSRKAENLRMAQSPEMAGRAREILEEFSSKVLDRNITPKEAGALQFRFATVQEKAQVTGLPEYRYFYQEAFKVFTEHPEQNGFSSERAESVYMNLFIEGRSEEQARLGSLIDSKDMLNGLLWLVKWYYLLTIPTLIVILRQMRRKQPIKETVLLHKREIFFLCLGGPMGLAFLSDIARTSKRYLRLEREYLSGKDWGYKLSREEKDALWLQTMKPLLQFEQALGQVRENGVKIRRPAMACLLVWFMSLHSQSGSTELKPIGTIISYISSVSDIFTSNNEPDQNPFVIPVTPIELPVINVAVNNWGELREPFTKSPVATWRGPRGPPQMVREGRFNSFFLTILLYQRKDGL